MVSSEELIGTTGYLTLYKRFRKKQCRYNRVRLYLKWLDKWATCISTVVHFRGRQSVKCSKEFCTVPEPTDVKRRWNYKIVMVEL